MRRQMEASLCSSTTSQLGERRFAVAGRLEAVAQSHVLTFNSEETRTSSEVVSLSGKANSDEDFQEQVSFQSLSREPLSYSTCAPLFLRSLIRRLGRRMDSVKALVSQATGSPTAGEDLGFMEDIQGRLTMSRKHRLYGFATCLGFGILFLFISTTLFIMPTNFAITYTLANILLMGSTMFLIGPVRQLKMMFDPVRFFATIAYLLSLILALVCALKLRNFFLTIIAIIIEAVAIAWYALSYIPFARSMVKTALSSCFPSWF